MKGLPIIGIDLGGSRAWSAALCVSIGMDGWNARALAPGIPRLVDQEQRDMVARGNLLNRLADQGVLIQAEGLRIPPAKMLINLIASTWGRPACLILDRFRIAELRDAGVPCRVVSRVTRWSESSYDIRALRSRAIDGPFAVAECSRELLYASLRVATVKNDDSGNFRLEKRGKNNTARDDCGGGAMSGRWRFCAKCRENPYCRRCSAPCSLARRVDPPTLFSRNSPGAFC